MADDTLIADLVRAGVDADLVGRVANAVLSATVRGHSADTADRRRADDRLRKRKKRELAIASTTGPEANDAVPKAKMSADVSAENAETRCDLLTNLTDLPSLEERGIQEVKKESRSRNRVLAQRGTRLSAESTLSNEDREFAWTLGFENPQIDRMWAEFVDYWMAVPGHRGVKLSWSATWRNRVREIQERQMNGKRSRQGGNRSSGGDFLAGLAKVAASISGDSSMAGSTREEVPLGRVNIDGKRTGDC